MLVESKFFFFIVLALYLSLLINVLFIFKTLANKYPNIFFDEEEEYYIEFKE